MRRASCLVRVGTHQHSLLYRGKGLTCEQRTRRAVNAPLGLQWFQAVPWKNLLGDGKELRFPCHEFAPKIL